MQSRSLLRIVRLSAIVALCFYASWAWAQGLSSDVRALREAKSDSLRKAEELVALMDYKKLFEAMMEQWPFDPLSTAAKQMGIENLPEERKKEVTQWLKDFSKKQLKKIEISRLEKAAAMVMAEVYSADELQGLIEFYQTEIGQAYLKKQPEFTRRMAAAYESIISENLGDLLTQSMLQVDTLRQLILHGTVKNENDESTASKRTNLTDPDDETP